MKDLPHAGAWLCLLAELWCAAFCHEAANTKHQKILHFKRSALKLNFKVNVEGESAWVLMPSQDDKISHPVFHWFLHKVEALPAGVKLVLVRTFEMQQVADDLKGIIGTYADEYGTRGYREYTLLTPSCVQRCVWVWQT